MTNDSSALRAQPPRFGGHTRPLEQEEVPNGGKTFKSAATVTEAMDHEEDWALMLHKPEIDVDAGDVEKGDSGLKRLKRARPVEKSDQEDQDETPKANSGEPANSEGEPEVEPPKAKKLTDRQTRKAAAKRKATTNNAGEAKQEEEKTSDEEMEDVDAVPRRKGKLYIEDKESEAMLKRQHLFEMVDLHTKGYAHQHSFNLPENSNSDIVLYEGEFVFRGPKRAYRFYNPRSTNPKEVASLASQPLIRNTKEDALIIGVKGGAVIFDELVKNWTEGQPIPLIKYVTPGQGRVELVNGHHRVEALLLKNKDLQQVVTRLWKEAQELEKKKHPDAQAKRAEANQAMEDYIEKTRWLVKIIDVDSLMADKKYGQGFGKQVMEVLGANENRFGCEDTQDVTLRKAFEFQCTETDPDELRKLQQMASNELDPSGGKTKALRSLLHNKRIMTLAAVLDKVGAHPEKSAKLRLTVGGLVELSQGPGELVWSLVSEMVDALFFMTAPVSDVTNSNMFKKVPIQYDYTVLTPALFKIFNDCYITHLQDFIATFAVDSSQLPDQKALWAVLDQFKKWYEGVKNQFSGEYLATFEVFPLRYRAVVDHFEKIAPHKNARLVMCTGHFLSDLPKLVKPNREAPKVLRTILGFIIPGLGLHINGNALTEYSPSQFCDYAVHTPEKGFTMFQQTILSEVECKQPGDPRALVLTLPFNPQISMAIFGGASTLLPSIMRLSNIPAVDPAFTNLVDPDPTFIAAPTSCQGATGANRIAGDVYPDIKAWFDAQIKAENRIH
ncbi:hypothetical protein BKA70DRAFT_1225439 [Coprinopsis sp. MPI-PUGE-AT-0042]|nr:hypothetical protein BKA70DRAFT_1225439 [Coprinopsis sp. MPI-PUGE-AT-0042]